MQRDSINFEQGEISSLFYKLLIPTLLGSLSISAMTAIDGIFIGHGVGSMGVAAVNITVPIFQLFAGVGLMIGVGCSVVASIQLSRKKKKVAQLNVSQALIFTTLFALFTCIAVLIYPTETVRILGASDSLTPLVIGYLKWLMPSFIFQMWSFIGLFIIRLDGSPRIAMWCNIIPALLNGILDWVMIFPLQLGLEGAAIATSISISIGGLMTISYLLWKAKTMRLVWPKFSIKSIRLSMRNIGYQCRIGFSSLLGEMTLAILVFIGNWVFMYYLGNDGVGAFGIACYYTPFFFMVGNAIAQSAQPIISYNFGISCWARIVETRRLLLLFSALSGTFVTIIFLLYPKELVALFVDSNSVAGLIAIDGIPYFSLGVVCFILNVALAGYYQSLERVRLATLYVLLRGLFFLVPCFILLPRLIGVLGIWLAMPISEILTLIVVFIVHLLKGKHTNMSRNIIH